MYQMFYNCKSLKYLDLFSLFEKAQSIFEMFKEASTNFEFCINDDKKIPNIFQTFLDMKDTKRNCNSNCYGSNRIYIQEKKLCCPKKEYNGSCYDQCPSRTRDKNANNTCENFSCPYDKSKPNSIYYTYEQSDCREDIPSGYFLNDSELKTIDKCHDDCETCERKETDSNHTNCLTCKHKSKKNIYLGNCYSDCMRGTYKDQNGHDVCKCFDERCFSCEEKDIKNDLCTECNHNENYYAKSNNMQSPYKCYKNLEKHFLSDNYFYPCYSSCQTCNKSGNEEVHNCITCDEINNFAVLTRGYNNCYPNCSDYFYFDSNKKYTCTDGPECPKNYGLIVKEIGQCVISCLNTEYYQYEYRGNCYKECPPDSILLDPNKKTCKLSCPYERPFMIKSTGGCVSNCTINERKEKECVTNYFGNKTNIQDIILNDIEEHLTDGKFDFSILLDESIIIEEENINYELTTTNNKEENSITSTLDLSKCEEALRDFYPIKPEDPLYILKYDSYVEGKEGPVVGYRIYYPLENPNILEDLQLTVCENLPVIISLPANITGDPALYDKNSAYYNDVCVRYSFGGGVDMTLGDRQRQFIQNNQSFCEEDCNFVGYDKKTGKVDCSCEIKFNLPLVSEIKVDKEKLYKFMDIKKIANFDVLKCWRLVMSKEGIITNVGFYMFIPAIICFFITIFFFYLKDFKKLKFQIDEIIQAKKLMKLLSKKKKPNPKPKKKIKPPPKYANPIIIDVLDKIKKAEEARQNLDPEFRKRRSEIIAKIMKDNSSLNKTNKSQKENLIDSTNDIIEENNINNEKEDIKDRKSINKGLIDEKKETPKNNTNILKAPPKRAKLPPKTEQNSDDTDIPSSKKNILLNKKGLQLHTYNIEKDNKEAGKLSKSEEEKIKNIMKFNDSELNVLDFKEALKYDNRKYWQYYFSLLKTKHMIVKIITKTDYNSRIIKIFLVFFNFSISFTVNTLFFNDDTMHKIFLDGGDFNFVYQLPQIAYSMIISFIFENIFNFLALSEENILGAKHEKNPKNIQRKAEEVLRTLQIKFLSFFITSFCLLMIFWYYITCFCAVYPNTQFHLIKDSFISFGYSLATPLIINLFPGLLRIPALKSKKEFLYLFSKILQLF